MSVRERSTVSDANVIGAIRLLVEGSSDDRTLRKVLVELLDRAAPTTGSATLSVWLLIDAVKAINGTWVVNDAAPMGVVREVEPVKEKP